MAAERNENFDMDRFGNPYYQYRGKATPQNIAFDANLQEFAYRVGIISSLENAGKTAPIDAYKQIRLLWRQLKRSKKNLLDCQDDAVE